VEGDEGTIHVMMHTGYEDFYLLIKLSYGTTYIRDGERKLGVDELLRLLQVANAFEFMQAFAECRTALVDMVREWDDAVGCFTVFHQLSGVEGMKEAEEAMGKLLGHLMAPLQVLWEPCMVENDAEAHKTHKLSERVAVSIHIHIVMNPSRLPYADMVLQITKEYNVRCVQRLPFQILAVLLASRYSLKFYTHNEPFQLLNSWLEAQVELVEEEKQALFEKLATCLEYNKMMPFYVMCVVLRDQRVMKSQGLWCKIAMQALRHTEHERQALTKIFQGVGVADYVEPRPYWVHASLTPEEIRLVAETGFLYRGVGVVAGLPWVLHLARRSAPEGGSRERLACFLRPCFPEEPGSEIDEDGSWIKYTIRVGMEGCEVVRKGRTFIHPGSRCWVGSEDLFRGFGDGVLATGSPFLTEEGHLLIDCRVTFL
jgi:hypothetical protein